MTHEQKDCMIRDCKNEASKWIANIEEYDTFYLCSDHAAEIANEDYEYVELAETIRAGEMVVVHNEIAEYSCHPDCEDCNR